MSQCPARELRREAEKQAKREAARKERAEVRQRRRLEHEQREEAERRPQEEEGGEERGEGGREGVLATAVIGSLCRCSDRDQAASLHQQPDWLPPRCELHCCV